MVNTISCWTPNNKKLNILFNFVLDKKNDVDITIVVSSTSSYRSITSVDRSTHSSIIIKAGFISGKLRYYLHNNSRLLYINFINNHGPSAYETSVSSSVNQKVHIYQDSTRRIVTDKPSYKILQSN